MEKTYTAFCSQDSSLFRAGLTLAEAEDEHAERTANTRAGFWIIMSDDDFRRYQAHDVDGDAALNCRVEHGVTKIVP